MKRVLTRYLHSFLHTKNSKSGVNFIYSISQFGGAIFQEFNSHMWPGVAIFNGIAEVQVNL